MMPKMVWPQLLKQHAIDSLKNLIDKARTDTGKIMLLTQLSRIYFNIEPNNGISFGKEALAMSEKIGWKKGIALANNSLGSNYWAKYEFNKAQDYYIITLKIAEEIGDNGLVAKALLNIGVCYEAETNYPKAIEYYQKSLIIFKKVGNYEMTIGCISNIAGNYLMQQKFREAINFYNQALQIAISRKDDVRTNFFYQKVGMVYSNAGNFTKAFQYYKSALPFFNKTGNNEDRMTYAAGLGELYLKSRNYKSAISQFKGALKLLNDYPGRNASGLTGTYYGNIGEAYFGLAKNTSNSKSVRSSYMKLALLNLQKAVQINAAINYKEGLITALENLSEAKSFQNDIVGAFANYRQYVAEKDSLFGEEKDSEYNKHALAFEYAKKRDSLNFTSKLQNIALAQAKIQNDNKLKQQSLYAIAVILVLSLVSSYFIFTNRIQNVNFKNELTREKLALQVKQLSFESRLNDLRLESLKSQMNPHFIFNCLNSIKYYVEINETEAASVYITKFSKLIRHILDGARAEKVSLATEIEVIRLYLDMEQMRLKDKLHYTLNLANDLNPETIESPSLLIQPYVENAIWHGIMNKSEGGMVKIDVKRSVDGDYLVITVADNGVGRQKAAEIRKRNFQHTSHASTLNNERMSMFNAKYNAKNEVVISDLKDADNNACGTLVTIKLQFNETFKNSNY
jgi:tetratricopeptide (TPR) repeat protein